MTWNALLRPGHGLLAALLASVMLGGPALADDPIKQMQADYSKNKAQKAKRAYHFGSQGAGDVFSNHGSHSNRLIPVYTFGSKVDLAAVTGKNSVYRDEARLRKLYGFLPVNTLNPDAEYADQADLYKVQMDAADAGVKHLFVVWFDGMDWPATQAAAVAKSGEVYHEGKGKGLVFQDFDAKGTAKYGYYVTSPTHDKNATDVDAQTLTIPEGSLLGGYDWMIAGPNPWTLGPLDAPGYLKGQGATAQDLAGVAKVGRVIHAYTDSSTSAAEFATGVKSYNNGVNVAEDGRFLETAFQKLQSKGWKVGTVTSVPFPHASPAAMYAHNVDRDDYQDLARDMLGLPGIAQETGKEPLLPGLDVVIGTGFNQPVTEKTAASQGKNTLPGNLFIADADLKAIDARNGGNYVVTTTESGANGAKALMDAATKAAADKKRLFGLYGNKGFGHLPYRTADGGFDPSPGVGGKAEVYTPADLDENPTLADMTRAALVPLTAEPGKPFALFVEAGDVDWGLHDNNLDTAIGAVISGDHAIRAIIDWVEKNSNWDDSAMIISSDHGHYLVIDDLKAIAGTAKGD
ncbi:alkaline phosphatase [Isosphaeraceae bacterium EP7]